MKKVSRSIFVVAILLVGLIAGFKAEGCDEGESGYGGQCVTYVRAYFGGDYEKMPGLCQYDSDCGAYNAWSHWDLGFSDGQSPANLAIMVMSQNNNQPHGHVAAVVSSRKKNNGTFSLIVDESNWDGGQCITTNVRYTYYPDEGTVSRERGVTKFPILGFIYSSPQNIISLDVSPFDLNLFFDPGFLKGEAGEVWLTAKSRNRKLSYDFLTKSWSVGFSSASQGELTVLEKTVEIPADWAKSSGSWLFGFAVDLNIDGRLKGKLDKTLFFDSERINLTENRPIFWLPLNDGFAEDIIGGDDGEVVGPIATTDENGVVDAALQFDGYGDLVWLNDILNGASKISIVARFKYDDAGDWRWIFGNHPEWVDIGAAVSPNSQKIRYHFRTTEDDFFRSDGEAVVQPGVWQTLVVTFDGQAVRGYLNGEPDFYQEMSGLILTIGGFCLGAGWEEEYFRGVISDFKIYDRVLSAAEIE